MRILSCLLLLVGCFSINAYAVDVRSEECSKMVKYAQIKHAEFSKGKAIESMIEEEKRSSDTEKSKYYKLIVLDVLDTFPIWEEPKEKARVNKDIEEYFYSICDAERIKGAF